MPYQETIRRPAKAHGRHKKQTGGRGQFGDCHIEIEPLHDPDPTGFEFVDRIKGGVIPHSFIPAVEKGVREAMQHGAVAGYPVKDVRVTLVDGSYHTSTPPRWRSSSPGRWRCARRWTQAEPVLLEPIMLVTRLGPRGSRRRRHRRPQRAPRPAAGDGARPAR